jgi:molybdopterin-biosynthesis enzyme MoeA-like protein
MKTTGAEMNETRMRMTRIPKGADLVLNKVSGAPGFWIGNVIVMAGVPSIVQAMLDEVAPKLKAGTRMFSETVCADVREGDIGTPLGEIATAHPDVVIGSYPFFDPQHGPTTNVVLHASRIRASEQSMKRLIFRFLSKSHLGECLGDEMAAGKSGQRPANDTLRRLVEAINNPGFP